MGFIHSMDGVQLSHAVAVVISELNDHVAPALTDAAQDVARTARIEHSYKDRSGALTRSIQAHPAVGQLFAKNLEAEVSADAGHAVFVEFDTKPHTIKAKKGGMLQIPDGAGSFIFRTSVEHPGTTGQRFLAQALEDELDSVTQTVLEGAMGAFKAAGFLIG